jgi:hypothetical protein
LRISDALNALKSSGCSPHLFIPLHPAAPLFSVLLALFPFTELDVLLAISFTFFDHIHKMHFSIVALALATSALAAPLSSVTMLRESAMSRVRIFIYFFLLFLT